ncbi:MAG: type I-MYXAN CRISPR-associated protein Cas6/Cmx6 [Gammaproteobacteria bacterium]|nr:type I-MYXAN CRISPR-associated protein Cas6/Cmx6 [Gammaproteobacteria bacterium]
MFWHEDSKTEEVYQVPDDVFDLVFKLNGNNLDIDHAFALSEALQQHLDADTCHRIGVHGIGLAGSGNGWNRPEQVDAELPLSRRARLAIRVRRDDSEAVARISNQRLQMGKQSVDVGVSSVRKLSTMGTLHARAVCCDPAQSEDAFLQEVADQLAAMGILVSKMICGKSGAIRTAGEDIYTRALLIADLKPEESVNLQQRGIGDGRLLGCGLFVPHRGIDAVYQIQD